MLMIVQFWYEQEAEVVHLEIVGLIGSVMCRGEIQGIDAAFEFLLRKACYEFIVGVLLSMSLDNIIRCGILEMGRLGNRPDPTLGPRTPLLVINIILERPGHDHRHLEMERSWHEIGMRNAVST